MQLSLAGVAVITGGGSGIGKEAALLAAQAGAAVAVIDINAEAVQAVAADIKGRGGRALALPCDIGNPDQVKAAIGRVASELGAPTALFNIAGMVRYTRVEVMELAEFNRVLS